MPLVVPDEGELVLLDVLLRANVSPSLNWVVRLYANNYTPNRESLLIDFTEASFGGYLPKLLTRSSWTSPATVAGSAQSTYGTDYLVWTASSGSETVYGYYVTDAPATVCLWAERFLNPMTVTDLNPALVLPLMRLRSENQPAP